jgi:hypothetical protein
MVHRSKRGLEFGLGTDGSAAVLVVSTSTAGVTPRQLSQFSRHPRNNCIASRAREGAAAPRAAGPSSVFRGPPARGDDATGPMGARGVVRHWRDGGTTLHGQPAA